MEMGQAGRLVMDVIRSYFEERSGDLLEQSLAEDVLWIGTGKDEICHSKEEALKLAERKLVRYGRSFRVLRSEGRELEVSEDTTCVTVIAALGLSSAENEMELPMRFSVLVRRKEGRYLILQLHSSFAMELPEEMSILQEKDSLTGIRNQEGFVKEARGLIRGNPDKRYAVIKLGINRFRYINQIYGYKAGDEVLRDLAHNLQERCAGDEVCGRIEKDNFAVMLAYHGRQNMEQQLESLKESLISPRIRRKIQTQIHFSAGIYVLEPGSREEIKDILDKTFLAQQNAREREWESHYRYFEPAMMGKRFRQQQLMEEAVRALDNHEFKLFIQPQVDILTGRIVGGEALVRWTKPDGKMIMPDEFILLFEQNGFIRRLDFYMLEALCRQMRDWEARGLPLLRISINQSRKHLEDEGYLAHFCSVVDRYAIPHEYIAFELTESAFLEYNDKMLSLARDLHREGFQLDIDDFGTGYSSLNLLSAVSADVLKVDRSLVIDCGTPRGRVVLKKVIEMAKETRMKVVCEGVETNEQLGVLKDMECDLVQGFYYYRPMPADEFEQRIRQTALDVRIIQTGN